MVGGIDMLMLAFLCLGLFSRIEQIAVAGNNYCDFMMTANVGIVCWPPVPPPPDQLSYDDGSPFWLTWSGTYRGVWFGCGDFYSGSMVLGCAIESVEIWFYHHPQYTWDTSDFYFEVYNASPDTGPFYFLSDTMATALHYAPTVISFQDPPLSDVSFSCVVNTIMSSGGWPSLICDSGGNFTGTPHSMVSDDAAYWEYWVPGEACSFLVSLERNSWGQLKSLFQ